MANNKLPIAVLLSLCVASYTAVVVTEKTDEQRVVVVVDALRELHKLLDDDKSGCIDSSESKDFLRVELQYEESDDDKEKYFHADGDDLSITVDDLYRAWLSNPVRNWTNLDILTWLKEVVQLPQYEQAFVEQNITGDVLPVLASQSGQFMQRKLGIVSVQHRKKLELRATDVVLFGPVSLGNDSSLLKDVVVFISLTTTTLLMCYAYKVRQKAQQQVAKMMTDVESLQQAERELKSLQERISGSNEVDFESYDKETLTVSREEQQEEIQRLRFAEEELEEVRAALLEAQHELAQRSYTISSELRQLLHQTYKREKKYYDMMKKQVLKEFEAAKDQCERINKKRSSLLGSLRLAHGSHFTDIDGRIAEARSSLITLTNDLQEQQSRWKQIEILCGQKLNSSLVSPVTLEPVREHEVMSAVGEQARNGWILSSVAGSGSDSVSVCSLSTRSSIPGTDGDGLWQLGFPRLKNRSNSETGTSATFRQQKVPGNKRDQLSFALNDDKQATGSVSSCSSTASLPSLCVFSQKGCESSLRQQQRQMVPLSVVGRQKSDPSLRASDEREESDLLNFYQNKKSYVADYNSLACAIVPQPERELANTNISGSRDNSLLDVYEEGVMGGNVSDSEVMNCGGKKKRKRFWSIKVAKNPNL